MANYGLFTAYVQDTSMLPKGGISSRDNRIKKHAQLRHCWKEDGSLHLNGRCLGRSGAHLFPADYQPGDITKLEKYVISQYSRYKRNQPNNIKRTKRIGNSLELTVATECGSVKEVQAWFRNGIYQSMAPSKTKGKIRLVKGGKNV